VRHLSTPTALVRGHSLPSTFEKIVRKITLDCLAESLGTAVHRVRVDAALNHVRHSPVASVLASKL